MQWHVHGSAFGRFNAGKLLHWSAASVRSELRLPPNPISALPRDGALGQLVFEPDLKFCSVEP